MRVPTVDRSPGYLPAGNVEMTCVDYAPMRPRYEL
jgi:hypothetical protein